MRRRAAAAAILSAAGAGCAPQAPAPAEPPAATGARIFAGNCAACHQPTGLGLAGAYPGLAGSPVVLGDPAELARWIVAGQRPAGMPAGRYSTVMPQFPWLEAGDAAALLTYLRSSFGNSATPVDAATVARALGRQGP